MRLRAVAIFAALFMLAAVPSFAQPMVNYGAKVGINFATVTMDPEATGCCGSKTGLIVGGFVDIPFTPNFSFQPEVLYTQAGGKGDADIEDEFKINLDYVQIPLLFKANFAPEADVKPFAYVGPGIAFKTGASIEALGVEVDIDDQIEGTNFSLIFGGGVTIRNFIVEARYDLGLSDLDQGEESTTKGRVFSILFGYGFGK